MRRSHICNLLLPLISGCNPNPSATESSATNDTSSSSASSSTTGPFEPTSVTSTGTTIVAPTGSTTGASDLTAASSTGTSTGTDAETTGAVCGNGAIESTGEQCEPITTGGATEEYQDSPPDRESPKCTNNCQTVKYCGDGDVNGPEGAEECDHGLMGEMPNNIGSSEYVSTEKASEEGYDPNSPPCNQNCKVVKWCGDGRIYAKEEECEDGDKVDEDECNNVCFEPRRVFVTAGTWAGDFGGVEGADLKCKMEGTKEGEMEPKWMAWLAANDAMEAPDMRINDAKWKGYYQNVCEDKTYTVNKKVNNTFVTGFSGVLLSEGESLAQGIGCDSSGKPITTSPLAVWTNVNAQGSGAGAENCMGWTSPQGFGVAGAAGAKDSNWTYGPFPYPCSQPARLYCFEVRGEFR